MPRFPPQAGKPCEECTTIYALYHMHRAPLLHQQLPVHILTILFYAVYVYPFRQIGLQGGGAAYLGTENALSQQVVEGDASRLPSGQLDGEGARGGVGVELGLQGLGFGDASAGLLRA